MIQIPAMWNCSPGIWDSTAEANPAPCRGEPTYDEETHAPTESLDGIIAACIPASRMPCSIKEAHLKVMSQNMLPANVARDIVLRKELVSLEDTLDFVLNDIDRFNDNHLARIDKQHLARR